MRNFLPVLALVACGDKDDDTSDTVQMPYCEETRTEADLETVSPLGFSGAQVLALAEDGTFDETWSVPLRSFDGVQADGTVAFDDEALAGSYRFDQMDPSEYDQVEHWLTAHFDGEESSGAIEAQASGEDECEGDDCTAWAANFTVATWGIEVVE